MSSRIWTNDTRRDEGEEKGRRAQNRRLPDTKVRNRGQQAPRTRARQELVSLPFKHPHVDMHACVLWYIIVRTFMYALCALCNRKQSVPAGRRHAHKTDRDQSACFGCHTNSCSATPPHNPVPGCLLSVHACYVCYCLQTADSIAVRMACVAWVASQWLARLVLPVWAATQLATLVSGRSLN